MHCSEPAEEGPSEANTEAIRSAFAEAVRMVAAHRAFVVLGLLTLTVDLAGSQSQEHKIDGDV